MAKGNRVNEMTDREKAIIFINKVKNIDSNYADYLNSLPPKQALKVIHERANNFYKKMGVW